jgi:hypothetical protein
MPFISHPTASSLQSQQFIPALPCAGSYGIGRTSRCVADRDLCYSRPPRTRATNRVRPTSFSNSTWWDAGYQLLASTTFLGRLSGGSATYCSRAIRLFRDGLSQGMGGFRSHCAKTGLVHPANENPFPITFVSRQGRAFVAARRGRVAYPDQVDSAIRDCSRAILTRWNSLNDGAVRRLSRCVTLCVRPWWTAPLGNGRAVGAHVRVALTDRHRPGNHR